VIPIFDPLTFGIYVAGYLLMLMIAVVLAPRVAGALSARLTLYGAMALTGVLVVLTTTLVIYLFVLIAEPTFATTSFLAGLVAFVALVNLITYLASPYIINRAYGARPDPELQQIVDKVARRLGTKPKFKAVVVYGPPNAFAYGNFLAGRYVAVTRSLLSLVDRRELEAVIGHEIGHHLHRDNAIMLMFGIMPSVVYYLGEFAVRAGINSLDDENVRGALALIGFGVLAIIASFVIQLLVLAFSRLREYYADTKGARAAGKEAMQSALIKLHQYYMGRYARKKLAKSKLRALFIYALTSAVANPFFDSELFEELLSTHPPIHKRIEFLDKYFGQ